MTHVVDDLTNAEPAAVQEAARERYRAALNAGTDLSAAELAAEFDMTDRWARTRRAEVKAERETADHAAARNATRSVTPAGREAGTTPNPADRSGRNDAEQPDPGHRSAGTASAPGQPDGNPAQLAQNRAAEPSGDSDRPTGRAKGQALAEPRTLDRSREAPGRSEGAGWNSTPEQTADSVPEAVPDAVPAVPARHGQGRAVAWFAFGLGIVASVAANCLHAVSGDAGAAELIGAGFWPIALLAAIELLTRVSWPRGFWWGCGRFLGVGLVAIVAAALSYRHMAGLLASWGEDPWNAHLGPLAVDGLMLVSATALLAITRNTLAHESEVTR